MNVELLVVVESGQENEEELYCQRSKLLRFVDGEWKERGLGEAKLLKHRESGRVRFLLRQENLLLLFIVLGVILLRERSGGRRERNEGRP